MKQMCNKMFTRMIIIFLCVLFCCFLLLFFLLSLEKLVVHAISFRLSEAELSI